MPDTLVNGFYTAADVHLDGVMLRDPRPVTPDADPRTCEYTHFDLTIENLGRTRRYNCWGFTFLPRRYWLSRFDVDNIIRDNCVPVADGAVEVGDIIRYRDGDDETQHTGRVWETDGAGHATWIRSKWGSWAEYIHEPLDVPSNYGINLAYFRQIAPLRGNVAETDKIADIWIRDSPGDDGEQYSGAPWWTSPDILVDVPPYDGSPDLNPVFDHPNRVWAVVRNRTNQRINNVYVRFYWADPATGLPPSNWNLIPDTAGHPNPVGPIGIDGGANVETDYVEWTPTAAPAHQCLLAIAYVNDDPQDCDNPNPLVYSFDIPWDNNIAQRNVHVQELENGGNGGFSIGVGNPFDNVEDVKGSLTATLTYSPRLPIFGFAREIVAPKVTLVLDGERKSSLRPLQRYLKSRHKFLPRDVCLREQVIGGTAFSGLSLVRKRPHRLEVNIAVPKKAVKGSVFNLHIVQKVANRIVGGYTGVVIVI